MSRKSDHWEEYYRSGRVVTSPMGSLDGYTGAVLAVWQQFFRELPDRSRIVDIGTGNGAIPLIAIDVARARGVSFDIHGVDQARIDPPAHVPDGRRRFAGIQFHPGVAAEALPFEDGSVQALAGQYALEYTDVPRTLAEIVRVLHPDGCVLFMVHHADSIIASNARESLRHGEMIFRETRVFDRLRQYLETERLTPGRAPALHRRLEQIGGRMRAAAGTSTNPQILELALATLGQIFAGRGRVAHSELLKALDTAERSFRANMQRLRDLIEAARSREDIEHLAGLARATGRFTVAVDLQHQEDGMLVAWRLSLTRPR